MIFDREIDVKKYVEDHNLAMMSGDDELRKIVEEVIKENPQSVQDYHAGKTKAMGFLVGQTMKKTRGQADPALVNRLLMELL